MRMNLPDCKERLSSVGVVFEDGLSEQEFAAIEAAYSFRFPDDLKLFLGYALPVSKGWVNWRSREKETIDHLMEWPLHGICFDIEHDAFWLADWGQKPSTLKEAFAIAARHVALAPKLIPIYSHRFMPDFPTEAGNPIYSVYQTDIIFYGRDLEDYLRNEFKQAFGTMKMSEHMIADFRVIPFWSDLVS